jgi:hypothetical protein
MRTSGIRITVEYLREIRACLPQRIKFREVFPRGAALTTENMRKAIKAELAIGWLIATIRGRAVADGHIVPAKTMAAYRHFLDSEIWGDDSYAAKRMHFLGGEYAAKRMAERRRWKTRLKKYPELGMTRKQRQLEAKLQAKIALHEDARRLYRDKAWSAKTQRTADKYEGKNLAEAREIRYLEGLITIHILLPQLQKIVRTLGGLP